jgi:hypothetical protein
VLTINLRIYLSCLQSEDERGTLGNIFAPNQASKPAAGSAFQWQGQTALNNSVSETRRSADDKKASRTSQEQVDEESDNGSDDSDEGHDNKRHSETHSKRKEEDEIRARENALMNNTLIPTRPEDFERQLLAEANNSFIWIQFMAYCIKNVDIAGCRNVAERALRTINFREEEVSNFAGLFVLIVSQLCILQEKMNVWMAYLNAELKHGDAVSFDSVFKRAVNESKVAMPHSFDICGRLLHHVCDRAKSFI